VAANYVRKAPDRREDETGESCELPLDVDPLVTEVFARVERVLGFANACGGTLRYRRYETGTSHPAHLDAYEIDGAHLLVTAMLNLTDTEEGGETVFPHAVDGALALPPRAGELLLWFTHCPDGSLDPASKHAALAVRRGAKLTLTQFVYGPLAAAAVAYDPHRERFALPPSASGWLCCVDDGCPEASIETLRAACAARDVPFKVIDAPQFDWDAARRLAPGDMLFRPAISIAAERVERFLYAPGVSTFYDDGPDAIFFTPTTTPLLLERAGLPVPRTVYCSSGDRALLRAYVSHLGGFPLVVKFEGGSGGVGVLRADSEPALYSLIDFALALGRHPLLAAYVPDAEHWRVVVVGDRPIAAYRNPPDPGDFRTSGTERADEVTATPPEPLATLGVRAVRAVRSAFGGVDVLLHPSGRAYVLEANVPCYFPHAQLVGGVDVAGAMVAYLVERARQLRLRYGGPHGMSTPAARG
jgi:hypothetical protein